MMSNLHPDLPARPERAATWNKPFAMHLVNPALELGILKPSPAIAESFTLLFMSQYLATHAQSDWSGMNAVPDGPGDACAASRFITEESGSEIAILTWLETGETDIWFTSELPAGYLESLGIHAAQGRS
jgi:hypothetical protein